MKKLSLYAAVFGLLSLASCKDDEGGTPITNNVRFNDQTYAMKTGVFTDYGAGGIHYNIDFLLIDRSEAEIRAMAGGEYLLLYTELFSPSTNAFETGTFEYYDGTDPEGKYYFEYAYIEKYDTDTETSVFEYEATGGTVTVSGGTNNEYTITYDLTMEGGRRLTGSFRGTFLDGDELFAEAAPERGARKKLALPIPLK